MEQYTEKGKLWIREVNDLWPGRALSLQVEKCLVDEVTKYQHLQLYQSTIHGNILCLDGVIQCTEKDEYTYSEVLAHTPLFSSTAPPKNVLIVGGGDGGVAREVLKHPIERLDLCEIDDRVVFHAKEHLKDMSISFQDPRMHVHFEDAAEFIQTVELLYDVIIVDSSDPIGPAQSLFQAAFYRNLKSKLQPHGIVLTQAENVFIHPNVVKDIIENAKKEFSFVRYGIVIVPTYPGGSIGVCVASNQPIPVTPSQDIESTTIPTKYYDTAMHTAILSIPRFASALLNIPSA